MRRRFGSLFLVSAAFALFPGMQSDVQAQPSSLVRAFSSTVTNRVSFESNGAHYSMSSDGNLTAYLAEISYGADQVHIYNRTLGSDEVVSKSTGGTEANDSCRSPSISRDGRYVVFATFADNLVAGDTNSDIDIFLRDRNTNTTIAITDVTTTSVDGRQLLSGPFISGDGNFIVYTLTDDSGTTIQRKIYDRNAATTSDLTLSGGVTPQYIQAISNDGNLIVFGDSVYSFTSQTGAFGIYLLNRSGATTTRIDTSAASANSNGPSAGGTISDDGVWFAFASGGTNLVTGDDNKRIDIFLKNLSTGAVTLVSHSVDGKATNTNCTDPHASADGRYIVFSCLSDRLVFGDDNASSDIFLYDRDTQGIKLLSATAAGEIGNSDSFTPDISPDGMYVNFRSDASNLVASDTNDLSDLFVAGTGVPVIKDLCPSDVTKLAPGSCGCGVPDTDSDSNGIADCLDADGNTVPHTPTLKASKKKLTITVTDRPPGARLIAYIYKGSKLLKTVTKAANSVAVTLPSAKYKVIIQYLLADGIYTQKSSSKSVNVTALPHRRSRR